MNKIVGQVIYCGPTIPQLGIHFGNIFKDGVHGQIPNFIAACPALGDLFVPVAQYPAVRRELKFDIARNMRGTHGRYPELYREVQRWLQEAASKSQQPKPKGVKVKTHA